MKEKTTKIGWKIMRRSKRLGHLRTLYRGLHGSRELEVDAWYTAERKWATEGGRRFYWSGFHVLENLADMGGYLTRFSKLADVQVVPCLFAGGNPKPTNMRVRLARHVRLLHPSGIRAERVLQLHYKGGARLEIVDADWRARLVLSQW